MSSEIAVVSNPAQQLPATLDRAEQAIQLSSNPEEINSVLAMMEAAVTYAKKYYKEEKTIIARAVGIRARAMRKLGELLQTIPMATGTKGQLVGRDSSGGNKMVPPEDAPPTLAEMGIDKRLSANAQQLAGLSDEEFARVESGEVSVAKAIAQHRESNKPEPKSEPEAESEPTADPDQPEDEPFDVVRELEIAQNDLIKAYADIEALSHSDLAKQVIIWKGKFDALRSRNEQLNTSIGEASKKAQQGADLLYKIRKVLCVEKNSQIIPAIQNL